MFYYHRYSHIMIHDHCHHCCYLFDFTLPSGHLFGWERGHLNFCHCHTLWCWERCLQWCILRWKYWRQMGGKWWWLYNDPFSYLNAISHWCNDLIVAKYDDVGCCLSLPFTMHPIESYMLRCLPGRSFYAESFYLTFTFFLLWKDGH